MPERRIRKLINNERKFLWSPGANVSVVARVKGNVPIDSLKTALSRIPEKHPLTSSRVDMDENRVLWFVHDPKIEIPLRVVRRESETQWIDEIRHEFTIPFNPFEGPLIRFVLVYSSTTSELVAFAQHAICDGTALAFLLRDILNLTANSEIVFDSLEPSIFLPDLLSERQGRLGLGQRAKSFFIRRINRKWQQNPFYFDLEDFMTIQHAFTQKYQYDTVLMEFSSEQTHTLTEICRANGVTVNSALTAAFNAAFNDLVEEGKNNSRRVVLPYDLRKRVNPPLGDVFCLLVGSVDLSFKYNPKSSFWQNVVDLHQSIKAKIEKRDMFKSAMDLEALDPTLADVIVSFALFAKEVSQEASRYEKLNSFAADQNNIAINLAGKFQDALPKVLNSNLGRLDFPRKYGQMILEKMYFTPAGGTKVPVVIGAVGINDNLAITLNYYKVQGSTPVITRSQLEQIRERAFTYLELNHS